MLKSTDKMLEHCVLAEQYANININSKSILSCAALFLRTTEVLWLSIYCSKYVSFKILWFHDAHVGSGQWHSSLVYETQL